MLVCYPKQLIVKSIIIVLLFFSSINAFAHKDKLVSETYGNVKTVIMTGFNYLDIDKIKIIGQLTKELSNRLKYRDTILIEYIHDYTNKYSDDLYLLEYNNSNYKLLEDSSIKSNYTIKSNGKGLSVRMYADNINIVDVLKLVEFTILNKEKTNSYLTQKNIGYNVLEDKALLSPLFVQATDDKVIKKIFASTSEIVNEIIQERILVNGQEPYGLEIYWQNGKFIFEYNNTLDNSKDFVFELEDYYYHLYVNQNSIVVFADKNSFYYLDGKKANEKRQVALEKRTFAPIRVMNFGDKILFQSPWNYSNINIFLTKKNKVISKFE